MTITLLNKTKTRLRVKEVSLPVSESPVVGLGIDVMTLPEGHLSCVVCKGHKFECWLYGDAHRIEMGCVDCNSNYRLLFPLDVIMPVEKGRFTCKNHPSKHFVLIHNVDAISIGCECCYTEINIKLKNKEGLIVAD